MKKKKFLAYFLITILIFQSFGTTPLIVSAEEGISVDVTTFPDEIFRNYVLENVDTDDDESLSSEEISDCKEINVNNQSISDLTGIQYFTELVWLYCDDNNLKTLDVSNLAKLSTLYCRYNELEHLDISNCTALSNLNCVSNQLTSLDVSACSSLATLTCSGNLLETLDLNQNLSLSSLSCEMNNLTTLNLADCSKLTAINCNTNQLTELDLGNKPDLTNLNVSGNQLTSLDVSKCTAITNLRCQDNQMLCLDLSSNTVIANTDALTQTREVSCEDETLDLKTLDSSIDETRIKNLSNAELNGTVLSDFDGYTDITFDYDTNGITTSGTAILLGVTIHFEEQAYINIDNNTFPDDNFRSYITSNFDANGEGTLSMREILNVTYISIPQLDISDLTGISYFTNLEYLNCGFNNLQQLDLSSNINLKDLECSVNQIKELDISNCTKLATLHCASNAGISLDVSNNITLIALDCASCELSELDLSKNTNLINLDCRHNNLYSVDLSNNTVLESLYCLGNNFTSLNLANNSHLTNLDVESLTCNLTTNEASVDLSQLDPTLNPEYISDMQGAVLNGTTLTDYNLLYDITYNYNTQAKDTNGDDIILPVTIDFVYEKYVAIDETNFPDDIFRSYLSEYKDSNKDGYFSIDELEDITVIELSGSDLSDLTGIEYFEYLTTLHVISCNISSVDLSKNTQLVSLALDSNEKLTSLELLNHPELCTLFCGNCSIKNLDLSGCTGLTSLSCSDNKLTELDLSNCSSIDYVQCSYNKLTSLILTNCETLSQLYCSDNRLKALDLSDCTNLAVLNIQYNQLMSLDLSNNDNMYMFVTRQYWKTENNTQWYNSSVPLYLYEDTTAYTYEILQYIYVYSYQIDSTNSFNLATHGNFDASKITNIQGGKIKGNMFTITGEGNSIGFDYPLCEDDHGNTVYMNVHFKLRENSETTFEVWLTDEITYTGKAQTPEPTVRYEDVTLEEGTDYTLSYSNNIAPGTATITVTGINDYAGFTGKITFTIEKASYTPTIKSYSGTYNGKSHTITLSKVKSGSTIKYRTSKTGTWTTKKPTRTSVGKTTVYYKITHPKYKTITGSRTITIKPASTKISKLTAKSKSIVVKWTKKTTQTTGYQIQYSTSSKFTSPKYATITKNTTTSKTLTKLKGNKKYYVRIRTYKTVNGTKYYSAWSLAKSIKTKK